MMMKPSAVLAAALFVAGLHTSGAFAQSAPVSPEEAVQRTRNAYVKTNNLVSTKLDVRFDYQKRYLYGKEWVTLKPDTKPTDSLRMDAKGMDIKALAVVKNGKNVPLKYQYDDSLTLAIQLDKTYSPNESYTLYIDYTAKPDQLHVKGSAAINDAKGLYFINPDSAVKGKPVQIWTQGESESSSAWFPTIDKPNQKTLEEITMTVPAKYVTLSNGRMISQKNNGDGTRTDTWKMDEPNAPYLFMMAVGDFKVYHDKWRDKPVDYLLEPKYAPYAKDIFGFTPEVIEFYSKTLGVDYPWNKYDQIVVRDYVSGAMENTTATLHGEYVQATRRELLDAYYDDGRSTIVHELFHQWFGDYVTCVNWSNLTVNESFADFSETLWAEHKYGKDAGDAHIQQDRENYMRTPESSSKSLVRYNYADKEDMFDVVTYQKGGSILYMLRNFLGNEKFYKGLNLYLKANAYKNGDAQKLRKALEEASGQDLGWFFTEWYYGAGHPLLQIDYKWNASTKTQTVYLQQTQPDKVFTIPMAIDIYAGGKKVRHTVWMRHRADTLSFHSDVKPDLVNVDGDKALLVQKTEAKNMETYAFQYFNAPLYLDRKEAIDAALARQTEKEAQRVLLAALKDKYYGLRLRTIQKLDMTNDELRNAAMPVLTALAQTDENTLVRAEALNAIAKLKAQGNLSLFKQALSSQSYAVEAAGLNGVAALSPAEAFTTAKTLEKDSGGALISAIIAIYTANGSDAEWPYIAQNFDGLGAQEKFNNLANYAGMTARVQNPQYAQQGIATLKDLGIRFKPYGVDSYITGMLNNIKTKRAQAGDTASANAADQAIAAVNRK